MNSLRLLYLQQNVAALNSEYKANISLGNLGWNPSYLCRLAAVLLALSAPFMLSSNALGSVRPNTDRVHNLPACTPAARDADSSLTTCTFADDPSAPKVNLLVLRGDFSDTARIHGRLLAREIDSGIVTYVRDTRRHFFESLPAGKRRTFESIFKCLIGRLVRSADAEFVTMHQNLATGLREGGISGVSEADIIEMGFANELGGIVSGLQRTMKRDPVAGYAKLAAMCGPEIVRDAVEGLFEVPDLGSAFMQMGCTGIAVSEPESDSFWMSRNLDGSALGYFDRHPTIIVHDPLTHNPAYHRYVGVAAAGLHYAGGNAGFNDAGIGVTLHEMETEKFRTAHPRKNALTAVYLQNRILERAGSIDEAWQIIKDTGNITAWTLVVGDAKTGEVATFEISGKHSVIAKRMYKGVHAQANKFISPLMQDDFYNYSFNKVLESRFRLSRVGDLTINLPFPLTPQWFVNTLSDHFDAFQGLRSFGRNIIKTNTMMTQIFAPGAGIIVTSIADRYPVGQGSFAEFKVDFSALDRNELPLQFIRILNSENPEFPDKLNWRDSLAEYVRAHVLYKANPDSAATVQQAIPLVQRAQELALRDGIKEFPYSYILAKLHLKAAAIANAAGDVSAAAVQTRMSYSLFADLVADLQPTFGQQQLHPYDQAMTLVWYARSILIAQKLGISLEHKPQIPSVEEAFLKARNLLMPLLQGEKQDLELREFLKSFSPAPGQWRGYEIADAAKLRIDFVTVE